jgi:hypothetical protein
MSTPNEYLKAISFIALDPNRHTKGMRLLMVKFFTLLELFKEKTGCLWARKDKKMTPHAHISTALVYRE